MGKRLTAEQRDAGLLEMCVTAGNAAEASRRLELSGVMVSEAHLRRLPDLHPARFKELRDNYAPKVAEKVARKALDIADHAADGQREAIAATWRS